MTSDGEDAATKYRYLPTRLAPTADATVVFLRKHFGLPQFKIEEPIHANVGYRPTLSVINREHEIICVEVSDTAYPNSLDQFILDCRNRGLPVKVWVSMPRDAEDRAYRENLARARRSGVGLLEMDVADGEIVNHALALSLIGVRPIDKKKFPERYRPRLVQAEATFYTAPDKACSILYDEIEYVTRFSGKKALSKKAWTKEKPGGHVPGIDLDKGNWGPVLQTITKHCNFKACNCPKLTDDLLTRVAGVVSYRNQVGHKVRDVASRVRRDTQLRTRFETAADILEELLEATRAFRP